MRNRWYSVVRLILRAVSLRRTFPLIVALAWFAPGCKHGFGNLQDPDAEVGECGNGQVEGSEICDDGNTSDHDGCSVTCEVETGWVCSGEPSVCNFTCGNGVIDTGEGCDDGDADNGDGCSANCRVEPGWVCNGEPSMCFFTCGNSVIDGNETCDDGNARADDTNVADTGTGNPPYADQGAFERQP